VGNGFAKKCEVQLAYAIGVAEPVSVRVETFGTGTMPEDELAQLVRDQFPLRPKELIDYLELKQPIYAQTAAYGHFGREDLGVKWEQIAPLAI
jgi:S-adenosylmethionine synthetase